MHKYIYVEKCKYLALLIVYEIYLELARFMHMYKHESEENSEEHTMKRTAALVGIVALAATTAFAFPGGFGRQGGQGAPCGGPGFGGAGGFNGPCGQIQQGEPLDEAGAKAKVQEYLDANLKGFSITEGSGFEMPRGTVYRYTVKDSNGNQFLFMVNPFGQVRGPITFQAAE